LGSTETDGVTTIPEPARRTDRATSLDPSWRRPILMMALPAVLLTVQIVGYVVAQGGAVEEAAMRAVLPFLIAANHVVVFVALLWVLKREGRTLGDVGWRRDRVGGSVLGAVSLGLGAALALYLFKELVLDAVQPLLEGRRPTFTSLFRFRYQSAELPLLAVATTLVAVEESVYRGYGLAALDRRWGRGWALLAMSLLFGLLHWGNGGMAILFTGVIGLAFGGLFLWRRSLLVPFVAHAAYNAMVILT